MCIYDKKFNQFYNYEFTFTKQNEHWDFCNESKKIQDEQLSPILFTMYIDGLFYEHKRAGVGCHINREFEGAFGYADEIVLLSPSYFLLCVKTFHYYL